MTAGKGVMVVVRQETTEKGRERGKGRANDRDDDEGIQLISEGEGGQVISRKRLKKTELKMLKVRVR